jgi:hypothetical protein
MASEPSTGRFCHLNFENSVIVSDLDIRISDLIETSDILCGCSHSLVS